MLENDGLVWTGKDLRLLYEMYKLKYRLIDIAIELGRTEGACEARLRMVKTAFLYYNGNDKDTLRTIDF